MRIDRWTTPSAEPRAAARRLVRHFTRDQFRVLVDAAMDAYEAKG